MREKTGDFLWPENWEPDIVATLMFVVREGKVLLIRKKTGIGQGKINAPGGKIEPGETPLECALRETEEELHIKVKEARFMGDLFFSFLCGTTPEIRGYVFMAEEYEGIPTETREAAPFWADINDVPYEKMWEDDRYWLPYMLAGKKFKAQFLFEGEKVVAKDVILWD